MYVGSSSRATCGCVGTSTGHCGYTGAARRAGTKTGAGCGGWTVLLSATVRMTEPPLADRQLIDLPEASAARRAGTTVGARGAGAAYMAVCMGWCMG